MIYFEIIPVAFYIYAPFEEEGQIALHLLVGRYVGRPDDVRSIS
jgi:hypothetical protein